MTLMRSGMKERVHAMNAVLRTAGICCFLLLFPMTVSASTLTDKEAKQFVTEWLRLSEENKNFDKVMGLYAEKVDFHKKGMVSRSVIAKDKKNDFSRWPRRKHTIKAMNVTQGVGPDTKNVALEFHYKISNSKKTLQGTVKSRLILRKEKGRIVIIVEKGDMQKQRQTAAKVIEQKMNAVIEENKDGDRLAGEYRDARRYHFIDADSDGMEDVVVFFTIEGFGGGNNYNFYMAIFKGSSTGYEYVDSKMVGAKLGAHLDFDYLKVKGNELTVKIKLHGPDDGACCPSITSYARYGLRKGKIVEIGSKEM